MKKFRFVGDPSEYDKPLVEVGRVYDGNLVPKGWHSSILECAMAFENDWEEVEEPIWRYEPPNQDQPASSMTKFEVAVFMAMQGLCTDGNIEIDAIPELAIKITKETFKQLEELK